MINNIKAFARFLDQPVLISKLNKSMPLVLLSSSALLSAKEGYDVFIKNKQQNKEIQKKNENKFYKNTFILFMSALSALAATKIASKITKRDLIPSLDETKKLNKKIIDDFILSKNPPKDIQDLLESSKENILSFKKVKTLIKRLKETNNTDFINKLIPEPQNVSSKDIFSEIGYLSIYGAVPVVGGIISGITADKISPDKDCKNSTCNKISEGLYQYLANIFLCNVGAGCALGILEKLKIQNKTIRALSMTAGIITTGVIGGNKIANLITKKVICPFSKNKIKERKPEIVDLGMHTDDIATVATLSGLKWIEPMLPFLYALSGYKSGIGYRN